MSKGTPAVKKKAMKAEFVDILAHPILPGDHIKEVLYTADNFHVWIHGDMPGTVGPMHRHIADQIFYCIKGECTFRFPDGSSEKLKPGMVVTIPKGQLYQLDNTGPEYMVMLGSRAEPAGKPRMSSDNRDLNDKTVKATA